jgi:uncharacterized protein
MKLWLALALSLQATAIALAAPSVPSVDHHQHLQSPLAAALSSKIPERVELPPPLAELLNARVKGWNNKSELAHLYADQSFAISTVDSEVLRGPDQIANFLAERFRAGYRMSPVAFNATATSARISGLFERDEAGPFGFFDLGLVRGDSSQWRIASETLIFPGLKIEKSETAQELVAALDEAGIERAVVLSEGYFFDSPRLTPAGGLYDKVRAENDWTAEQVAQYPERLLAFFSVNPLSNYAVEEVKRCAATGKFKGLKLHFGVSGVDLKNPEHVEKVRRVVGEANRLKLPLIVHVRADGSYGAEHARILLDRIVSAAPDVPFTIAHLWGGESYSAEALKVYADAVTNHDPNTKNLYFDIAEVNMVVGNSPETAKAVAERMRQIGIERILYGTDGPIAESQTPKEGWEGTRAKLPLSSEEFGVIAGNVAPYLRAPR